MTWSELAAGVSTVLALIMLADRVIQRLMAGQYAKRDELLSAEKTFKTEQVLQSANIKEAHHRIDLIAETMKGLPGYPHINDLKKEVAEVKENLAVTSTKLEGIGEEHPPDAEDARARQQRDPRPPLISDDPTRQRGSPTMAFDLADFRRGADRLAAPTINLMAVNAIESSGENFWLIGNKHVPPIRLEAHWFSKQSGRKFDKTHPDISSPSWKPELAAKTKAGAWEQYERAAELDPVAAAEATSWGPFQIMGFHWRALAYASVQAFVDDVDGPDDDGQMDMFVRFVQADRRLLKAIREDDWDLWEKVYNGGGYGGAYADKIREWKATHGGAGQVVVPRVVKKGHRGPDVAALQGKLGIFVDGNFGAATDAAVRIYQAQQRGLVVDGIVGIMTLRALGLAA